MRLRDAGPHHPQVFATPPQKEETGFGCSRVEKCLGKPVTRGAHFNVRGLDLKSRQDGGDQHVREYDLGEEVRRTKPSLNQAIGASDHPFLRMHAPTLNQLEAGRNGQEVAQLTDDMANFKLTGTDADMEYYEKRYQQRLKEERMRARGAPNIKPPARRQALPQTRSGSSSTAKAKTTSSRSGKPSGK
eukprot:XP_011678361.1 PREDICTED: protein FAM221A-like [Strongylocentrotus purpuratus]